jgi:Fe-S cluster assembly protein SufD
MLDIFEKNAKPDKNEDAELSESLKSLFIDSRMNFDAVIGSGGFSINKSSKYITIVPASNLDKECLEAKLHKSTEDKLAALIHAFTDKVMFINIGNGEKARLNLLFSNNKAPISTQIIINVGDEADLEILEWYASTADAESASAFMHEGVVGKYSNVSIDAVHNEGEHTVVVGLSKYAVGERSNAKLNYFYGGGSHCKVKNYFYANEHESSVHVNELTFGSGKQKFDISSQLENRSTSTIAELHSRAVVMNDSFCIMKGFAKIPFGSKNSRSFVHESGMLLDEGAAIESIPAMSIDESEVKATHSSATGPIDDELIFYLNSKGLSEKKAKMLVVEGFFSGSVGRFRNDNAKLYIASLILDKIERGVFGKPVKVSAGNIWVGRENEEDIFKGHYKYR